MTDAQSYEFPPEEIARQIEQLRDEGVQVADMVEVDQRFYAKAMAVFAKTYSAAVLTNGYFDLDLSTELEKRRNQATLWFPQAVAFGTRRNEDGSPKTDTFTALSINSNASVANGPSQTCNCDAKVRAGVLVAETNWLYADPIVQAVVVYADKTACNALAVQKAVLDAAGIQIAGYSKGANYDPNNPETFTLERELMDEWDIPLITSPIYGTPNPTYPQTDDRPELEAALAGTINLDSLRFLVTPGLQALAR
jgi:hypothetical protein